MDVPGFRLHPLGGDQAGRWSIWVNANWRSIPLVPGLRPGTASWRLCRQTKALVADLAPPALRGTAFGWFNLTAGLLLLPASLLFGALYQGVGALAAFGFSAACGVFLVTPLRGVTHLHGALRRVADRERRRFRCG